MKNIYLIKWLNICCVLIFFMILIGGATRLTQSGLSMVDWKPLIGIIPPLNEESWNEKFNAYKEFPEYQKINRFKNMQLDEFKNIFYWEYSHRLLGRIIGLFFIVPFLIFWRKGLLNKNLTKKILYAIVLLGIQGLLGWFMVKSGLVDNPHVSHYRLASHLFLAFILIAYMYWIKLSLEIKKEKLYPNVNENLFNHIYIILFLYVFQVLFGAFIAGTKAGLLWNTFPLIEGQIIPDGLFALSPFYVNFFENMKMFQFSHRLIGNCLLVYSGWFFIKSQSEFYNKYSGLLFMTFIIQFFIGIMTLLLKVPLVYALLHQGIAVCILLILVNIIFLFVNRKIVD